MNDRLDRSKLIIGTYYLKPYATTEQHIKDLAECGIDLVVCMHDDRKALDLLHKYGVKVILRGVYPLWVNMQRGKLEQDFAFEQYQTGAETFVDHPAICGIDLGDEPSALDFPYCGKLVDFSKKKFPHLFPYLNLLPNYATVAENTAEEAISQLGTATYEEHIKRYCETVSLDYICYDYYMYVPSITSAAGAYENLRVVADACRDTGRSPWIVLQVNSINPDLWISENQLRFQAYTAMAFGVELITWACYTAGWWENQVLDLNGEKTQQYDKLKTVNAELKALGETYMKYRRTSTHFVGFGADHPDMAMLSCKPVDSLSTGIFFDVKADAPVIIGQMVGRDPAEGNALMIATADDPQDIDHKDVEITFRAHKENGYTFTAYHGAESVVLTPDENGIYHVPTTSCSGVLITAK